MNCFLCHKDEGNEYRVIIVDGQSKFSNVKLKKYDVSLCVECRDKDLDIEANGNRCLVKDE